MKSLKYIFYFVGLMMFLSACEPQDLAKTEYAAPDATQVNFTVTPVAGDQYKVKLVNTSTIVGIPSWKISNGDVPIGSEAIQTFNMKGTYTITLTLFTKGGYASVSKTYTQPLDNTALLLNDKVKKMIGTVNDPVGKTWVLDQYETGHLGVGPNTIRDDAALGTTPATIISVFGWWTAKSDEKTGWECYDDEFTFIFADNAFKAIYKNNGKSFVRVPASTKPQYTNIERADDGNEHIVTYEAARNGVAGGWEYSEDAGKSYITFKPINGNPIYPIYDCNSSDNKYRLAYVDDDHMMLIGQDENNGNSRLIGLKRKGYVKPIPPVVPEPTYDVAAVSAAPIENTFNANLTNIVLPTTDIGTASIASVTVDFGDGTATVTSTNKANVFAHQYIYKGTFTVTFKVISGTGAVTTKTTAVTVANNITGYVPYLISQMIVYNDFGETQLASLTGESTACTVNYVTNPSKLYPNRSTNVAKIVKTSSQYDGCRITLPNGRRFNLTLQHTFKVLVYGTAGDQLMLNLINTDKGGDAWKSGTNDFNYTIKKSNTWEVAEYNMAGISLSPWGGYSVPDVTLDPLYNQNYYNVLRLTINNGAGTGAFTMYVDDIAGPHVEGLK